MANVRDLREITKKEKREFGDEILQFWIGFGEKFNEVTIVVHRSF